MAQFVVRDLEEEVKVRLKRRAQRQGRSMEEEIRHILRNAAKESGRSVTKLGSRMAASTWRIAGISGTNCSRAFKPRSGASSIT